MYWWIYTFWVGDTYELRFSLFGLEGVGMGLQPLKNGTENDMFWQLLVIPPKRNEPPLIPPPMQLKKK